MKEKKSFDENDVFAKRLKSLFENSDKTHLKLAEYIEQETGESVTRQAVGQWCNGNTSPNTRTIRIIAKFFNVSTDYLFGLSDQPTNDKDLAAVAEYIGITSKTVEIIKNRIICYLGSNAEDIKDVSSTFETIIGSYAFIDLVMCCRDLAYTSKAIFENDSELSANICEYSNISDLLGIDSKVFYQFIVNRKRTINKYDRELYSQCDMFRYENFKSIEMISDLFDFRKKITSLSINEICDILDIDETTLNDLRARKKGD